MIGGGGIENSGAKKDRDDDLESDSYAECFIHVSDSMPLESKENNLSNPHRQATHVQRHPNLSEQIGNAQVPDVSIARCRISMNDHTLDLISPWRGDSQCPKHLRERASFRCFEVLSRMDKLHPLAKF